MENRSTILQGTLDLMVLKTLDAMGPMHGYGLARRIEQISEDALLVNQGTIQVSQNTVIDDQHCGNFGLSSSHVFAGSRWEHGQRGDRTRAYRTTRTKWAQPFTFTSPLIIDQGPAPPA